MKGINLKYHSMKPQFLLLLLPLLMAACEDPRPTQREGNIFDPENAFLRFNYENTVTEPALDSLAFDLSEVVDTTVVIPIALSAAPQEEAVLFRLEREVSGSLQAGQNFELLGEDGEDPFEKNISLAPGVYDYELRFQQLDSVPAPGGQIRLRLVEVVPDFIKLGFPGSGRGQEFTIIYRDEE